MCDHERTAAKDARSNLKVMRLSREAAAAPSLTGEKGANLARLLHVSNVSVPPAYVITTTAYGAFLDAHPEIGSRIQALRDESDPQRRRERAVDIQARMLAAEVPHALQKAIHSGYGRLCRLVGAREAVVSVRSSATCEDGLGASSAGQYLTLLDQHGEREVVEGVRHVWASAYAPGAVAYRDQHLHQHPDTSGTFMMAVILQVMVPARVAGVAFNVDPENGAESISLSVAPGLGTAVVDGHITPDVYVFDAATLACISRRREAGRETQSWYLELEPARRIARIIRAIGRVWRRQFGVKYVDVEFALDAQHGIHILQVRPETAWAMGVPSRVATVTKQAAEEPRANAVALIAGGMTGSPGSAVGRAVLVHSAEEAIARIRPGDILVAPETTNAYESALQRCGGVVTDIGGPGSHTAVVTREMGKPALVATGNATRVLIEGEVVTLDATSRCVYAGAIPLPRRAAVDSPAGDTCDESEPAAWAEAQRMAVTYVDERGDGWIAKPGYPIVPFLERVYMDAHRLAGQWLGIHTRVMIHPRDDGRRVHWVNFHDLFHWQTTLRGWSFEDLERLVTERQRTGQAYLEASRALAPLPEAFQVWLDLYVRLNALMGVSYDLYKAVEHKLRVETNRQGTHEVYLAEARHWLSSQQPPLETTLAWDDYRALLADVTGDASLQRVLQAAETSAEANLVLRPFTSFGARLIGYATHYKVTPVSEFEMEPVQAALAVIRRLNEDVRAGGQFGQSVDTAGVADYFPDDGSLRSHIDLAVRAERARQNAHHLRVRGHFLARTALVPFTQHLMTRGQIRDFGDLLAHTPEWWMTELEGYVHRH